MISNKRKKESKYLIGTGKSLLLILYNIFFGLSNKGSTFGRMTVLEKVSEVTETCFKQLFEECLERYFSIVRKTRSNKYQTLFKCDKKWNFLLLF